MASKNPDSNIVLKARNIGLFYNTGGRRLFAKKKHRHWALKDVSFDLHRGECLGFVGKNGAGKSTLMRLIAGIHKPDTGTLENYGHTVALLSLGAGFLNDLSGRDNMILSGMLLGLSRKQVMERLEAMIAFSELEDSIDEQIYTYSTGMRARLGFSVAIQSNPDVILVDEVLGVGDKDFRQKSSTEMKRLIKSGKTVVLISHNKNTISELCDRAVWLHQGCSEVSGDVDKVMAAYEQK